VDWIYNMMLEVPAVAPYRAQLEALAREHAALTAENARLNDELAWFIPRWDTLDGDAVRTLEYLSRVAHGHPQDIARAHGVNIQIVESYLAFLVKGDYVHRAAAAEAQFRLSAKGRRYLSDRGLLQG